MYLIDTEHPLELTGEGIWGYSKGKLVELKRFELSTSALRTQRSPN